MKILVLGCNGQLGKCLQDQLSTTDHDIVYTSRDHLDIADFHVTECQLLKLSPDLVINATAYTAVDNAEEDKETADIINHLAVSNVAVICNELDCWLIHISTDYVFDGTSTVAYKEEDKTNPQGVYGATKLMGEIAIQSSGCRYLIIRTAWVFSEYGNNFLKTMLRLGAERDQLNVVNDQIGCPTYAQDIAKVIGGIIPELTYYKKRGGLYHYCGDQPCTWYDFASEIFDEAKIFGLKTPSMLHTLASNAYPTKAKRPAFSVLDCNFIEADFAVQPSNWRLGIRSSIRHLQSLIK